MQAIPGFLGGDHSNRFCQFVEPGLFGTQKKVVLCSTVRKDLFQSVEKVRLNGVTKSQLNFVKPEMEHLAWNDNQVWTKDGIWVLDSKKNLQSMKEIMRICTSWTTFCVLLRI